jgi:hypothetical protein
LDFLARTTPRQGAVENSAGAVSQLKQGEWDGDRAALRSESWPKRGRFNSHSIRKQAEPPDNFERFGDRDGRINRRGDAPRAMRASEIEFPRLSRRSGGAQIKNVGTDWPARALPVMALRQPIYFVLRPTFYIVPSPTDPGGDNFSHAKRLPSSCAQSHR